MTTTRAALTAKHIAARVGVTPNRHGRALWTIESVKETAWVEARACRDLSIGADWQRVGEAAQMLLHLNTGRLPNEAALALREMSAYRAVKVVAAVAASDLSGMIEIERARVVAALIMKEAR